MKLPSVTFFCDFAKCDARQPITVWSDNETAAYLELVDKRWTIKRPGFGKWSHYCPKHRDGVES